MHADINFGCLMLAAEALNSTGLADLGYTYVNIGENYRLFSPCTVSVEKICNENTCSA